MLPTPTRAAPAPAAADFTSPLSLPGGSVAGAELVRELPSEVALPVWQALRSVLLWAQVPAGARGALFEEGAMAAWECRVLTGTLEEAVRSPLAVLAREMTDPEAASAQQIAWACFCITEWALGRRANATAIVFAEAAALAWPEHPRYAWAAGRLMRTHGKFREAEIWLRRAIRISSGCADWQMQVLGLNSLGNVLHEAGRNPEAARVLLAGVRAAKRHRLRSAEGELWHDLMVVATWGGSLDDAERYAAEAARIYEKNHPRLTSLAHDMTYVWMMRGNYAGALQVLLRLLPSFDLPEMRVRVLASIIRAAGGCGSEAIFDRMWNEAEEILNDPWVESTAVGPMYEMGLAAACLRRWESAAHVIGRAARLARLRGEADVVVRAEIALDSVRLQQTPEPVRTQADEAGKFLISPLMSRFLENLPRAPNEGAVV